MNDIESFLSECVYYPCSHFHFGPIKLLSNRYSRFFYADYSTSREDFAKCTEKKSCDDGFFGYRLSEIQEISPELLFGISWEQMKETYPSFSRLIFGWKDPFAVFARFERESHLDENHGPASFEMIFARCESVAAYQSVFNRRGIAPKVVVHMRPGTALGGNYSNYSRYLNQALSRNPPDYILHDMHAIENPDCKDYLPLANNCRSVGNWTDPDRGPLTLIEVASVTSRTARMKRLDGCGNDAVILPLLFESGHLFLQLDGDRWLIDTGAPNSFGDAPALEIAGERIALGSSYMGLTAQSLSEHVGVSCKGLLGANFLGRFDFLFDVPNGRLTISRANLAKEGHALHFESFMGIPILTAHIQGKPYPMFFDTGARVSYLQDDIRLRFPAGGSLSDFYPGFGSFQTETHEVPVSLGDTLFTLRCGVLPGLLGASLMMADSKGIIGNSILSEREVGYFPRRGLLVL